MEASDPWRPLAEALLGKAQFTAVEVAREAGFDLKDVRRLWRALGFPPVPDDARVFSSSDIDTLRAVRQLLELQDTDFEVLVQLTRVTAEGVEQFRRARPGCRLEGY